MAPSQLERVPTPFPRPATSDAEKVRFNQINEATGHRIKMQKVDAETGEVVDTGEIVEGYKAGDSSYRDH
jgi:DNA end-binding protein Ku